MDSEDYSTDEDWGEIDENNDDDQALEDVTSVQSLTIEQVKDFQQETLCRVSAILNTPPSVTRELLRFFKWESQELIERFFNGDEKDQARMFKEANVAHFRGNLDGSGDHAEPQAKKKNQGHEEGDSNEVECGICCSPYEDEEMTGLQCGHRFCKSCWVSYLTTMILGGKSCIGCPASVCGIHVDHETIMSLITDPNIKSVYNSLAIRAFVQSNRTLRWCPGPDCSYCVKSEAAGPFKVMCNNGHAFCFSCGEKPHEPIPCEVMVAWDRKGNEDVSSLTWVAVNTKPCPGCKVPYRKEGGCNHMICTNEGCRHEFCWMCLHPWSDHLRGLYRCNIFSPQAQIVEKTKAELERFRFYRSRYNNHQASLDLEGKLVNEIDAIMEKLMNEGMLSSDVQFLRKAVEVLHQCRETLMHTYVFAFFLMPNNQTAIFEANQHDLESATEALSAYLERQVKRAGVAELKPTVEDKFTYCDRRRAVLIDHIREGTTFQAWVFSPEVNN